MSSVFTIFKTISWRWHTRNPGRLLIAIFALLVGSLLGNTIIDLNARTAASFSSAMSASMETYGTEIRFSSPISSETLDRFWDRDELTHFHFIPFMETSFTIDDKRYPLTITFCQLENCIRSIQLPSSWKYFLSPDVEVRIFGDSYPVQFHSYPIATARLDLSAFSNLPIQGLFLPRNLSDSEMLAIQELFPDVSITSETEKQKDSDSITYAFRQNLFALALISLLVAGYLVFASLDISFENRSGLFSSLITLGVGRKTLGLAILTEALLLGLGTGLLAWMLGSLLAVQGWQFLGMILPDVFGVIPGNYQGFIEGSMIIPISGGVSVLSAYLAYRRRDVFQSRSSVSRDSLKKNSPSAIPMILAGIGLAIFTYLLFYYRDPRYGYVAVFLLFFCISKIAYYSILFVGRIYPASVEWKMAYRALVGYNQRFTAPISALSVAISLCIAMTVLIASFKFTLNQWLVANVRADSYFSIKDSLDRDKKLGFILEAEKRFPGQVISLKLGETSVLVPGINVEKADIMAQDFELIGRINPPAITEGKLIGILASETAMLRWNLEVGDRVAFPDWGTEGVIGGIYKNYTSRRGSFLIDISDSNHESIIDRLKIAGIAIHLNPLEKESLSIDLEKFLIEYSEYGTHQPSEKLRAAALELFDKTFSITYILQSITFLLASASIAFALISLLSARKREFAIVASYLSNDSGALRRIVIKEAIGVMVASLLIAIPGSAFLTWVLIEGINRFSFGWTLAWNIPYTSIGLITMGSFLSGIVTSYLLGRKLPVLSIWKYLKSRE